MGHDYINHRATVKKLESKGFTLIASLLLMLLLSGIAIGLLMMVNTEGKVGGTDLQNNMAFHAAEGGIEKMSSDLSTVFQSAQSPTPAQICGVGLPTTSGPVMMGVTWKDYSVMPGTTQGTTCPASMTTSWGQITGGPDQGLWAQVIPVNMLATAAMPGGQEVSMTRNAEVALIPVFQYGVFCDGDCGFFDSPNLTFAGRVHTNADLYLGVSGGSTLIFNNKLEAYGNVVTEVLPNGLAPTGSSWDDTGNVYIPTTTNGCSTTTTNCVLKSANGSSSYGDGSLQGAGGNPPQSTYNKSIWNTFSTSGAPSGTNYMLVNGNYGSASQPGTGAKQLALPFVSGTNCPGASLLCPYQIIRRPLASDSTALSQSREYNMAQIRVILSDNPADPFLKGAGVRLANITSTEAAATGGTTSNPYGIAVTNPPTVISSYIPTAMGALAGSTYNMYFAAASNGYLPDITSCPAGGACPTLSGGSPSTAYNPQYLPADWPFAPQAAGSGYQMLMPAGPPAAPVVVPGSASPYPTFALCPPSSPAPASTSIPAGCPTNTYVSVQNQSNAAVWNLIDGYLYVEYEDASSNWHNVTNEWLNLGFARGMTAPTANGLGAPAGQVSNPINPYAILLLQEPADRNGSGGAPDFAGQGATCTATSKTTGLCTAWNNPRPPEVVKDAASGNPYYGVTSTGTPTPAASSTLFTTGQSVSMFNWYPINFYDAREGEPRDADAGNNSCTTNGVMNAVELDVGNLNLWLQGKSGSSGTSVNSSAQNGYVLYFSDRRGMLPNPNYGGALSGDSGLEDVVNSSSASGVPDGKLEPIPAGHALSPEDVNENHALDNFGINNLGLGQWSGTFNASTGLITGAVNQNTQIVAGGNPYSPRIASCQTTARKSWVSGARHVLKLVDGWLGNVPTAPASACQTVSGVTYCGGFTVASENPVYVQGNYNSNSTDTFFTGAASGASGPDVAGHSAAAVIADAVTILSNNWNDETTMVGVGGNTDITANPAGNRSAATTYYRLAVAGGKNMAFPFPAWETSTDYGFGTDGGIHNFLRFLENWQGQVLNYGGSLVSLYYATYNTGVFKCCAYSVYAPPVRNYIFDGDFTNPAGLPPGTPMFRDIESLGYRQMFATRTK
jgi:hypothetical protein